MNGRAARRASVIDVGDPAASVDRQQLKLFAGTAASSLGAGGVG